MADTIRIRAMKRVASFNRSFKRLIMLGYDTVVLLIALMFAFITRTDGLTSAIDPMLVPIVIVCAVAGIVTLYLQGVYGNVARYIDHSQVKRFAISAFVVVMIWVVGLYLGRRGSVPRSIGFLWFGYLIILWQSGRYIAAFLMSSDGGGRSALTGKAAIIYGANIAGLRVAEGMRTTADFHAVCFIDEDAALWGQRLNGLRVHSPREIGDLVRNFHVKDAFLALPSASRRERFSAIDRLTAQGLRVKHIPDASDLLSDRFTVSDLRPVEVSDLLSRTAVLPHRPLIEAASLGHSILVTGAGGSIGSEICRQLVRESPARVVLLDHSEFALYAIEQELATALGSGNGNPQPEIFAIVGSILDSNLLEEIINRHAVDTIYHAAAYKHVPLLEVNEVVGIRNNVIGTQNLVTTAVRCNLKRFVMISTDKAVRPTNVMGATKRVAELIVQRAAEESGCLTRFGIVRFGNVLDSSGSVVHLFRRQISEGRAITLTHRDVTRYFMSIPEATQLVLQAGAMARRGEIFVLDMGEPVRIYDLAVNMIRLSGLSVRDEMNPDGDIAIEIVGLRPGEKLYEELFVHEVTEATSHPRIRKTRDETITAENFERGIQGLMAAILKRDVTLLRRELFDMIAHDHEPLRVAKLKN